MQSWNFPAFPRLSNDCKSKLFVQWLAYSPLYLHVWKRLYWPLEIMLWSGLMVPVESQSNLQIEDGKLPEMPKIK